MSCSSTLSSTPGYGTPGLHAWTSDDCVFLVVGDNGDGFDPEVVNGEPQAGGGFGLASVRERVEQVGGRIEITAAPGDGTRVRIEVPVAVPAPDAQEA